MNQTQDSPKEPQVAQYRLSSEQNVLVHFHQQRLAAATQELQTAEKEAAQAKQLFEARQATLDARKAVYQAELDGRNVFLAYIVKEFGLPATKDKIGWAPQELEPGKYALLAQTEEALPAANPPGKAAKPPVPMPRQQWKRKKNGNVKQFPAQPAATQGAQDTPATDGVTK